MHDIVTNSTDQRRPLNSFHPKRGVDVIHCVCHRLALILSDAIKGTKAYDPVISIVIAQAPAATTRTITITGKLIYSLVS
jgi:hypothetical protein